MQGREGGDHTGKLRDGGTNKDALPHQQMDRSVLRSLPCILQLVNRTCHTGVETVRPRVQGDDESVGGTSPSDQTLQCLDYCPHSRA